MSASRTSGLPKASRRQSPRRGQIRLHSTGEHLTRVPPATCSAAIQGERRARSMTRATGETPAVHSPEHDVMALGCRSVRRRLPAKVLPITAERWTANVLAIRWAQASRRAATGDSRSLSLQFAAHPRFATGMKLPVRQSRSDCTRSCSTCR